MTQAADRISVLVADDHPLYRAALVEVIAGRPKLELVGEAEDGEAALAEARRLCPDVTVLDLSMPVLDGAEVLAAIQDESIATRVLFLAASTDSRVAYELLSAGAAGYLDKGVSAGEICDSIESASLGETVVSQAVERGVLKQIEAHREWQELSAREVDALRLLADGLSAAEIAARLGIESSTVKSHLHHLYGKLRVSDRAAAVAEGMRRGLVE